MFHFPHGLGEWMLNVALQLQRIPDLNFISLHAQVSDWQLVFLLGQLNPIFCIPLKFHIHQQILPCIVTVLSITMPVNFTLSAAFVTTGTAAISAS